MLQPYPGLLPVYKILTFISLQCYFRSSILPIEVALTAMKRKFLKPGEVRYPWRVLTGLHGNVSVPVNAATASHAARSAVYFHLFYPMSDTNDLAKAMKTALDESGDLIRLRACLEEKVLDMLKQEMPMSEFSESIQKSSLLKGCKPAMPSDIILANNMIRQYLIHAGLQGTSAVLCTESGIPEKAIPECVLQSSFPSLQRSGGKPVLWDVVDNILKTKGSSLEAFEKWN